MTPTLTTSMENTAAASGVPKRAAKAADMPHMVMVRWSFSSRRIQVPSLEEIEPPSWRAAPSRPEEPPVRWVSTVARKMRGAVRRRMGAFSRTAMRTKLVPWSRSSPQTR